MCGGCSPAPVVVYVDQTAVLTQLAQLKDSMEELMATVMEQLTAFRAAVTDFLSDITAKLEQLAQAQGQFTPEAQALFDSIKADVAAKDAEVGDADGSEVPPPPV